MDHASEAGRFAVFFTTWIVLGIGCFLFFYVNRDARKKKKAFPYVLIGTGLLFIFFVLWVSKGGFLPVLPVVIPAVGLIMFLNYKGTDFCENCGRTLFNQNPFSKANFCKHCGKDLTIEKPIEPYTRCNGLQPRLNLAFGANKFPVATNSNPRKMRCYACGSERTVEGVKAVDLADNDRRAEMRLEICERPGAKLLRAVHEAKVMVTVCADCGNVMFTISKDDAERFSQVRTIQPEAKA